MISRLPVRVLPAAALAGALFGLALPACAPSAAGICSDELACFLGDTDQLGLLRVRQLDARGYPHILLGAYASLSVPTEFGEIDLDTLIALALAECESDLESTYESVVRNVGQACADQWLEYEACRAADCESNAGCGDSPLFREPCLYNDPYYPYY